MKESESTSLQKLLFTSKWFPYFPAFAITLGVFRLIVFYETFDIHVLPFLDFSEIILSFMDILLIILVMALLQIIEAKFSSSKRIEENKRKFEELKNDKSGIGRLIKFVKWYWWLLAQLAFLVIVMYIGAYIISSVPLYIANFMGIFAALLIAFIMLRVFIHVRLDETNAPQEHRDFMHLVIIGTMYLCLVWSLASLQGIMLKEAKEHQVVSIKLNDNSVISTNDSYYYIGRTKGYIFLYSKEQDRTDVISSDEVKSMKFYAENTDKHDSQL